MSKMIEALKKYLDETPIEDILKDWESTNEWDDVGITVDEYLKELETYKNTHNE